MQNDTFIHALLDAARAAGIAEAEVYYLKSESLEAMIKKGEIDEYSVNTSGGLSLRGLVGGKMGSAYSEALDEKAIAMLIDGVKSSAALITDEDEQFIFAGSLAYETVDATGDPGEVQARLETALRMERAGLSADPRVTDLAYVLLGTERNTVRIVNTHGLDLSHTSDHCVAFVMALAREGDRVTTGTAFGVGLNLRDILPEAIAREAVMEAVEQLPAAPCESGRMPAILRHTAMADLLGTFSSVFSADAAQKGFSLLAGKEGEQIAAPCVTLVDDPLQKGGVRSRAFDAEGVATYTKHIIENGVLTTLLHNLKTAKKAGCASTGNAARAGYAGSVTVAPRNLFFAPGAKDLQGLTAEMGDGIVITDLDGLHAGANEVSGDFSLLAKGYLVRNGQRQQPVEQITVAGNFFELLKSIEAIGNDLRPSSSMTFSPSVRIKSLSVAGK